MLSFLFPAFLIGALAAAVPVILHLTRRDAAPEVAFSAVRLLKRAPVEQARPKRLREWLLLALRIAVLVLLAAAFARPYLAGGAAWANAVTVVAVDRSYSMGAPGQFDRALALARAALRDAPALHAVSVVAFDDGAEIVVEPTANREAAVAALDRLETGFGGTRYPTALALAASAIGGRDGRIVVVTDLQGRGWEAGDYGAVAAHIGVEVAEVSSPAGNLGVTALHREAGGLVAVVANSAFESVRTPVRLEVDGRLLSVDEVVVPPRGTADVRFEGVVPRTGVARVAVNDLVGYPADDARYLLLDPPAPGRLLAMTGAAATGAFYLERALVLGDDDDTTRFTLQVAAAEGLRAALADEGSHPVAVMLLSTRGLDRRTREQLAEYVRDGGGLMIAAGDDVDPAVVEALFDGAALGFGDPEPAAGLSLAPADTRHPVLRSFGELAGNLGLVGFSRIAAVMAPSSSLTIARFTNGAPALVEQRIGRGRVLLFASDLNTQWNDFPLQPTFVPFVHEMMRYVSREGPETRALLIGDLPEGIEARPGAVVVGPERRQAVVNVNTRESDPARVSSAEFQAAITRLHEAAVVEARADAREREERQNIWWYGLLLAVGALVAEGLIGRRARA